MGVVVADVAGTDFALVLLVCGFAFFSVCLQSFDILPDLESVSFEADFDLGLDCKVVEVVPEEPLSTVYEQSINSLR